VFIIEFWSSLSLGNSMRLLPSCVKVGSTLRATSLCAWSRGAASIPDGVEGRCVRWNFNRKLSATLCPF